MPPDQRWRGQDASHPAGSSRGSQLVLLVAVLLALAGGAAAWILYVRPMPEPFCLALPVRDLLNPHWPVHAWADQDAGRFARHFPEKSYLARESQDRDRLIKEIKQRLGPADQPLVVYLSALAVGKAGDVYLIPSDADPDSEASWLALRDVLQILASAPNRHKLLLLDIAHPLSGDGRLGILADTASEYLHKMLDKNPFPNLLVLVSTSGGQTSWRNDAEGCSNFAYYLDRGLRGGADGWGPQGRVDGRISVSELAAFTMFRAERWALQNRGQKQTPRLVGTLGDFPLVNRELHPDPGPPKGPEEAYPPWLAKGWTERDRFLTTEAYRNAPRPLAQFEARLQRIEELWRGGFDADKLAAKFKFEQAELDEQLRGALSATDLPARSLARSGAKKIEPMQNPLKRDFERAKEVLAKPEELAKVRESYQKVIPKEFGSQDVVYTVVETLTDWNQPSAEVVKLSVELIGPAAASGRFVELVFLQRMLDFAERLVDRDPDVWKWPGAAMQQLLKTTRARELCIGALANEPGLLPWVEAALVEADKQRRRGEKGILWERPPAWPGSQGDLQQAETQYQRLRDRIDTLSRERRASDSAFALLPGFVPFLREQATDEASWKEAIAGARKLSDFFANPRPDEAPTGTGNLQSSLRQLDGLLARRAKKITDLGADGGISEMLEASAILASPRLSAKDRVELWTQSAKLARKLHARTEAIDQADDASQHKGQSAPPPSAEAGWPQQRDRALRSARLSLDVLTMGNIRGSDVVRKELAKNLESPHDLIDLGQSLRNAWSIQMLEQVRAFEKQPLQADRLVRLAPPLELDREGSPWSKNPTGLVRREEKRRFAIWLSDRFRDDEMFVKEQPMERTSVAAFYREASLELRR